MVLLKKHSQAASPEYKAFAEKVQYFLDELKHAQIPMKKTVQEWQDHRETALKQAKKDEALKPMYQRQAQKLKNDCQKVMKAVDVMQAAYVHVRIQFEEEDDDNAIFPLPDPLELRQKVDALAGNLVKLDLFSSQEGYAHHSSSNVNLPEFPEDDAAGPRASSSNKKQKNNMSNSTSQNSLLGLTSLLGNNSYQMSSSSNQKHEPLTSQDFSILDDDSSTNFDMTPASHDDAPSLQPIRDLIHQMHQAQDPLKERLRDLARKRQDLINQTKEIDLTKPRPPTKNDVPRRIKHVEGEMRQVMEAIDCWQGHEWDLWMQLDDRSKELSARAAAGFDTTMDGDAVDPSTLPSMALIQQQVKEVLSKPVVRRSEPQLHASSTNSTKQWALEGAGGVGKAVPAS